MTINKAIHNKKILEWFNALPVISTAALTKPKVVTSYARHLGCPVEEIVQDMTGEDDLDFLWETYKAEIEA